LSTRASDDQGGVDILRYRQREKTHMTDVLIRDVPDDVVSAIEAKAKRLGLSRTVYLRRQMLRVAATCDEPVSVESLHEFARTFADLADPEVMRRAWQ